MNGFKVPRKIFFGDLVSGLVMTVVSIPGGLANGLLVGVNPIFGLYSMIAGTPVAAVFTSSVIMNVDSTGATALATLDALRGIPEDQQLAYLIVLGLLLGLFMLVLGLLKLGFLVRFISNSVMTGFLSGLDWTIIRPSGLTDTPQTGGYEVGENIPDIQDCPC